MLDTLIETLAGVIYACVLVLGMPAVLILWMAFLMR